MQHTKATKLDYCEWYISDPEERGPRTRWCDEHGVHESTAIRWEAEHWFDAYCNEAREMAEMGHGQVRGVVEALRKKAEGGDAKAAETYLRYIERNRKQDDIIDTSDLSDVELLLMLEEEIEGIKARIAANQALERGAVSSAAGN